MKPTAKRKKIKAFALWYPPILTDKGAWVVRKRRKEFSFIEQHGVIPCEIVITLTPNKKGRKK